MAQHSTPTTGTIDQRTALFDRAYRADRAHLNRLHREVYGDEHPDELEPYSFTTRSELRRFVALLALPPGGSLLDLGCGEGGPGLWVARQAGATLTGLDLSAVAVARAGSRVADFGLAGRARFAVGDFAATGLPAASFDGVLSIDVLWALPDKGANVPPRLLCYSSPTQNSRVVKSTQ
jgi:SAM-dependent methyltransferase